MGDQIARAVDQPHLLQHRRALLRRTLLRVEGHDAPGGEIGFVEDAPSGVELACGENDTVEITGEYSPPEKMFNTARLRSRQLAKCGKR